jgi:hypothetical protein
MSRAPLITSKVLAHQQVLQHASEDSEQAYRFYGVAEHMDPHTLRELVAETLTANAAHRAVIAGNDVIRRKARRRLAELATAQEVQS